MLDKLTEICCQDKNKINMLLCLTENTNYFVVFWWQYQPVAVTVCLHLYDTTESERVSESEGKFAKLVLRHAVSGPLTLLFCTHNYFLLCL
jgi:hypothetical protein